MLVNAIGTTAWVVGTPITYATSPIVSTNNNVELNDDGNGFIFNTVGWYRVRLQAVIQADGTSLGCQMKTNAGNVTATSVSVTTVDDANTEICIEYPIHVESASAGSEALVQFIPTTVGNPVNGYVFIDKME